MQCIVCHSSAEIFWENYWRCSTCDARFLDPASRLHLVEERRRYEQHNNDVNDPRYRAFVSPLVEWVKSKFSPPSLGLDFGAGTGPVLATLLQESGFPCAVYDPIFHPNNEALSQVYDFIVASEVAEHLFDPRAELIRLREILRPEGMLCLMTLLYDESLDFPSWYYRRDPTHVVFYSRNTFEFIRESLGYAKVDFPSNRLIILTR